MKYLSIAIAIYNEERYLKKCLDSVIDIADELIIVDGGSIDRSVEIARSYNATIIQTDNPPMFHINKQKALDACTSKWILQLDADEVIPKELAEEIVNIIHADSSDNVGFYIARKNNFWGHWMKKTGVFPDYSIRLIKNGKGNFPCKSVHEFIQMDGKVGYLNNPMLHFSYETMNDYWRKSNTYTTLTAMELKNKKIPKNITSFLYYFFGLPTKTFFVLFIRNFGFMDGFHGFLFSLFSGFHHPIAYWKYMFMSLLFLFLTSIVKAEYVLPYPGTMPGNKLYKISIFVDHMQYYWAWGNIGRINYFIEQSDKYLVEAKTLFEYKQYFLATQSLEKSDEAWDQISVYLYRASKQNKDIKYLLEKHQEQSKVHQQLINDLKTTLPESYVWSPEKSDNTELKIVELLTKSFVKRKI